jgi:hypothetical protein
MSEDNNAGGDQNDGGSPVAGNTTGGGFLDSLASDYRDPIAQTGIKDADGLAKAYINAQQAIGASIRIPGADAGPDDIKKFDARLAEKVPSLVRMPGPDDTDGWKTFYQRLGVPEAPTAYKFTPDEGLPNDVQGNLDQWFAPIAHTANLSTTQAAAVRAEWFASIKAAAQEAQSQQESAANELREKWGAGYDQRLSRALGTLTPILGAERSEVLKQQVDSVGLGNAPLLIEYMERVADFLGEDRIVQGQRPNLGLPDSLDEIKAKIAEIQGNPAYKNNLDPNHKPLVSKMENLFQQMAALKDRAA